MTDVDRTPKPCPHPNARHQHGTRTTYISDNCRCHPCTEAATAYRSRQHRARLNLTDAEPVRRHVERLLSAGLQLPDIARLSGVATATIRYLMTSDSRRIRTEHAHPILAATIEDAPESARINARGATRRVRALARIGWDSREVGRQAGVASAEMYLIRAGGAHTIPAKWHRGISDVYERLSAQPMRTGWLADRTRRRAELLGWAPPLAWDDIDTDDAPNPGTRSPRPGGGRPVAELIEDVEHLALSESPTVIARQLGMTPASISRALWRAGRGDLASRFDQTSRRAS